MSDLANFREWASENKNGLVNLLGAAGQLIDALRPKAQAQGMNVQQLLELNDDPTTMRAILDGVNIAEIAGQNGITIEKAMEALGQVLNVAKLATAIF